MNTFLLLVHYLVGVLEGHRMGQHKKREKKKQNKTKQKKKKKKKKKVFIFVMALLVSEVFGGWGNEAQEALSRVAK